MKTCSTGAGLGNRAMAQKVCVTVSLPSASNWWRSRPTAIGRKQSSGRASSLPGRMGVRRSSWRKTLASGRRCGDGSSALPRAELRVCCATSSQTGQATEPLSACSGEPDSVTGQTGRPAKLVVRHSLKPVSLNGAGPRIPVRLVVARPQRKADTTLRPATG
jgi:hypothetical protein